ncbi:hypothetical protein TeGR_g9952, partial [Tetraparma gracilis]
MDKKEQLKEKRRQLAEDEAKVSDKIASLRREIKQRAAKDVIGVVPSKAERAHLLLQCGLCRGRQAPHCSNAKHSCKPWRRTAGVPEKGEPEDEWEVQVVIGVVPSKAERERLKLQCGACQGKHCQHACKPWRRNSRIAEKEEPDCEVPEPMIDAKKLREAKKLRHEQRVLLERERTVAVPPKAERELLKLQCRACNGGHQKHSCRPWRRRGGIAEKGESDDEGVGTGVRWAVTSELVYQIPPKEDRRILRQRCGACQGMPLKAPQKYHTCKVFRRLPNVAEEGESEDEDAIAQEIRNRDSAGGKRKRMLATHFCEACKGRKRKHTCFDLEIHNRDSAGGREKIMLAMQFCEACKGRKRKHTCFALQRERGGGD